MKFLFILIALPVMASKCSKNKDNEHEGYLKGKVVRVTCASLVVQVLNDDTVGEDGWKDMMNNNAVYDNVFTANNSCKIPAGVKGGATIYFKIKQPTQNDCVLCMMYDGPPGAKFDIEDVSISEK